MSKVKTQILFVHGGMTFRTEEDYYKFLRTREIKIERKPRWDESYVERQLDKYFTLIKPRMPLADNAKYKDWKIHFERYIPYLRPNFILIGSSLGGIFLAKYLSENKFPKKILSVYLVCPPYDGGGSTEELAGGFKLKSNLSLLEKNCRNLYLLFSSNDEIIPLSEAAKYNRKLSRAKIMVFDNVNGHFKIAKFPEIIKLIKADKKIRS